MRRLLLASLLGLALVVPAGTPVAAVRPPSQVPTPTGNVLVGVTKLLMGWATRSRIYRNVNDLEADLKAQYAQYLAAAEASKEPRTVLLLTRERDLQLSWLEGVKKNGFQTFTKAEPMLLLSIVANSKEATKFLGRASGELLQLQGQVKGLHDAIANGTVAGGALATARTLAANLDRWSGAWFLVSGGKGAQLAAAAERASRALRRVDAAAAGVQQELTNVTADLQGLADSLASLPNVPRRPRTGNGLFGFLATFLRVDRSVVDVLAEIFNPRLRNMPGMSREKLEASLRTALSELIRRRLQDCVKAAGPELRALLDEHAGTGDPDATRPPASDGEKLPICEGLTTEQVVGLAEAVDAAAAVATTGPSTDRPFAGGTYTLVDESTDPSALARVTRIAQGSLDVSDRAATPSVGLSAVTIEPMTFEVVFDLAKGQVHGSFSATFTCGPVYCPNPGDTAEGTVVGSFGPFPYGESPSTMPADFPFTEEHWTGGPGGGTWWAGGAVDIDVTLSGSYHNGTQVVGGTYATTMRAWVTSELRPLGVHSTGQAPPGWSAGLSIRVDDPGTTNPQWNLYLGASASLYDRGVAAPPGE